MAWYRSGTVSVTNGSATVTGSGTDWVTGVGIGEAFNGPDGKVYEIASIVSATQLTLGSVYLGATASGQAYQIIPSQSYIRDLAAQAAQLVSDYASVVSNAGSGKFTDGTAAAPGIRFTADENVGIRRAGADDMRLVANGQDKVTITGSGVSIPTLTSNPTLSAGTANGVLYLNGSKVLTTGSALTFDGTKLTSGPIYISGNNNSLRFTDSGGSERAGVRLDTDNLFAYGAYTAGHKWLAYDSEQMRLTSTGLGIGTSSPGAKLEVAGAWVKFYNPALTATGNATTSLLFDKPAVGWSNAKIVANQLSFDVQNNGDVFVIDSSGNLGLGVTPSAWGAYRALQVNNASMSSAAATSIVLSANTYNANGSGWKYISTAAATQYEQFNGGHYWSTAPSGTAGNPISFTQAMTLDASGRLGIGVTSPAAHIDVAGSVVIRGPGSNSGARSLNGITYGTATYTAAFNAIQFNVAGGTGLDDNLAISFSTQNNGVSGERARIDSGGNLLVGTTTTSYDQFGLKYRTDLGTLLSTSNNNPGFLVNRQGTTGVLIDFYHANNAVGNIATNGSNTSYNTSSDYRLKNITGPVTNSGAYIDSLNPVEGTWKADGSTFVGLIAHEVQEVSRTQVATGEKDGAEMQAMDYSNSELIANLIAEVQALRKRVAQLEAR